MTVAVATALAEERKITMAHAKMTPSSSIPTIVDILREAGRRARSRGAAQVTPLDVRLAAQLFAPWGSRASPCGKPFDLAGVSAEVDDESASTDGG